MFTGVFSLLTLWLYPFKMIESLSTSHASQPQWATGSRLLKLGEAIEFHFYIPEGAIADHLTIFSRYLESADPGNGFVPGNDLNWLEALPSEKVALAFEERRASVNYTPEKPGNYLAWWRVGEESLYRYFSVVEDDWVVLRFCTFVSMESEPTLHSIGIPLDYRLPAAQFDREDPLFKKFFEYYRRYGDSIIPFLPDVTSSLTSSDEQRFKLYELLLNKARCALPFPDDIRSARLEMHHEIDPGYTKTLAELGIHDHCGLFEANAKPWLGMPEFPYFSSPADCRKANQDKGGPVVAHQWDFCGSWHFLGPVSWHYKVSEGDWPQSEACINEGLEELVNLAKFSGHPAFAYPLYDGVCETEYPKPDFQSVMDASDKTDSMPHFVERYQRFMAFEAPKVYKVAYARSIDIADYYNRHYTVTPRTVFVSKTDHVDYDKWWLCHWVDDRILIPRETISWDTNISDMMSHRRYNKHFKDPLSYEYILLEDQCRSIRFERECPNPIWWFDYTKQERGRRGSIITHTETPDVDILMSDWEYTEDKLSLNLKMATDATFPDYAIALWNLPEEFSGNTANIQTNAKDSIMVWNRDGEHHLVLVFDLEPNLEIQVCLKRK